jgi:hypothetical protein
MTEMFRMMVEMLKCLYKFKIMQSFCCKNRKLSALLAENSLVSRL